MKKRLKNIDINSIKKKDRTYIYTFPIEIGKITESIKKVGLLNPVVLCEHNAKYRVISGLKRVLAADLLSFKSIDAFVIENHSISELEIFLTAIYDNISIRSLNIIEKSNILNKLKKYYKLKEDEIIKDFMPLIGLGQSRELLYEYLKLSRFGNKLKEHIVKRDIQVKTFSLLTSISGEKLSLVSEIITAFNLGTNKIKEFIRLVDEILERDGVSIERLRSDIELSLLLKNERLTLSQKWDKVITLLREKRFPIWGRIEKELKKNISYLNLPKNILLNYPPYLEGDKLKIEVEFSSPDELKKFGNKLVDISKKKELLNIIKLL